MHHPPKGFYWQDEIDRLQAEKAAAVGLAQARIDECRELTAEVTRLRIVLEEISNSDRRNGMLLSSYEAAAIAKKALANDQPT